MRSFFKFNGTEATDKAPVEIDNSAGGTTLTVYSNVMDCNKQKSAVHMLYAVGKLTFGTGSLIVNLEVCGAEDPISDWAPWVDFSSSDDISFAMGATPVGAIKGYSITSGLSIIPGFARLRVTVPANAAIQMYAALHFFD